MAQLSQQSVQMLERFKAKYPDFSFETAHTNVGRGFQRGEAYINNSPAAAEFDQVKQSLAQDGFHFNPNGTPQENMATWKQIAIAAAVAGGVVLAGTLLPVASQAAGIAGGSTAPTTAAIEAGATTTAGSLATTGAPLASTQIGNGFTPAIAGNTGIAGTGGSFMSNLMNKGKEFLTGGGKDAGQGLADISSLLGKYAQTSADSREDSWRAMDAYDRNRLDAQQDQRIGEADALKKMQQTEYIGSGGRPYVPPTVRSGTLPNFGFGPVATTATEKAGASDLQAEVLKRLQPGGFVQATDPSKYLEPGTGEKVANAGSLMSGLLSGVRRFF